MQPSDKYTIKELYKKGIVSAKVLNQIELKDKAVQLMRTGMKKAQAVKVVSNMTGQCTRTVYRAMRLDL